MKKSMIKGIASVIFASALLCSCDLLDLTPKAAVTVKTYFKNESELELYANRFYYDIFPGGSGIYKEIGDNMIWIPLASEVSLTRTVPERAEAGLSKLSGISTSCLRISAIALMRQPCGNIPVSPNFSGRTTISIW